MTANVLQILIVGLVQGAAELLPVSSSAPVIIAENPTGSGRHLTSGFVALVTAGGPLVTFPLCVDPAFY